MLNFKIFIELTRLNKPIGYMLLFWPCSWGLAYGYGLDKELNIIWTWNSFDNYTIKDFDNIGEYISSLPTERYCDCCK